MAEEIKQLQNKRKNSSARKNRKNEKREIDGFMRKEQLQEQEKELTQVKRNELCTFVNDVRPFLSKKALCIIRHF